jgi:hypothetical protein
MSSAASTPVSKRQFLNALVCPTMAFRDRHATSPALETATQWRFHEGNRVGALARTVLGGGRMLPPPFSDTALVDSAAAIAEGGQTLFEATMSAAGMIARADALVPCADGWELIEVKSGKMPESGIASADYINDIAFTLCVAQTNRSSGGWRSRRRRWCARRSSARWRRRSSTRFAEAFCPRHRSAWHASTAHTSRRAASAKAWTIRCCAFRG